MTENPDATTETETKAPSELERRFRRLLRAYPYWYRRHRGEELVGTLLDACGEDQDRPTRRQRRDILRSGLACRLRVRGGKAGVVLAVFLALMAAVAGSWIGARLGWVGAPDPPNGAEATAVAAEAFDGRKPDEVHGDDAPFAHGLEYATLTKSDFGQWTELAVFGGDSYRRAHQVATYEKSLSGEEWAAMTARVTANLEAAGWRDTHEDRTDGDTDFGTVTAVRDGQVVTVDGADDGPDVGPWIQVTVVHTVPAGQSAGLVVGAGLGLLVGWLLGVRIAWQWTVVTPRRRTLAMRLLFTSMPFGFGILLTAVTASGLSLQAAPTDIVQPPWYPLMNLPFRPLCLITAVLVLAAVLVAMLPGRRADPRVGPARQDAAIG